MRDIHLDKYDGIPVSPPTDDSDVALIGTQSIFVPSNRVYYLDDNSIRHYGTLRFGEINDEMQFYIELDQGGSLPVLYQEAVFKDDRI